MIKTVTNNLRTIATFGVLTAGLLFGYSWLDDHYRTTVESRETTIHQIVGNPYLHHGDGKPNATAKPGDLIYVHNKYIKSERCHVQVANLLINRQTDDVLHFSTFQNWFPSGTFTANEMFKLPEWLPEGTYRLMKRSTSFCGDKVYYFVNFDLELKVAGGKVKANKPFEGISP